MTDNLNIVELTVFLVKNSKLEWFLSKGVP